MGAIREHRTERVFALRSRCVVGRHPSCDVCADHPRISGEHANVRWTLDRWELRDLGSKNGTFCGGRRLAAGGRVTLAAGDTFALGGVAARTEYTLIDAAPPVVSAAHLTTGEAREALDGLLVLPSEERPFVSVVRGEEGRWMLESEAETRPAVDREVVRAGGEDWRLDVPTVLDVTCETAHGGASIGSVSLRFRVSLDEERVELTVVHGAQETTMASRSHFYLLLVLARARLSEVNRPPDEQGWMDREELCRMLRTDEYRLNVDVYRLRKQLAALGIQDAACIVERRGRTGRMRIGARDIHVGPL